jgi:hypothetical protein
VLFSTVLRQLILIYLTKLIQMAWLWRVIERRNDLQENNLELCVKEWSCSLSLYLPGGIEKENRKRTAGLQAKTSIGNSWTWNRNVKRRRALLLANGRNVIRTTSHDFEKISKRVSLRTLSNSALSTAYGIQCWMTGWLWKFWRATKETNLAFIRRNKNTTNQARGIRI